VETIILGGSRQPVGMGRAEHAKQKNELVHS
jgi:hypothetical protein